jgi:hypothetical protein
MLNLKDVLLKITDDIMKMVISKTWELRCHSNFRVKEGFPGYVVAVNFALDTVTVDLTKLAHMPNKSSVYTFSTTYAHSFTAK